MTRLGFTFDAAGVTKVASHVPSRFKSYSVLNPMVCEPEPCVPAPPAVCWFTLAASCTRM